MGSAMRALPLAMLVLVIIGGSNRGRVGRFGRDLAAALLGTGSMRERLVYALVGLSEIRQLVPLVGAISADEPSALRGGSAH
jgi:uncharacterized membrane protein YuzA (DUF378 family)